MELPALVKHVCTVWDISHCQLGDLGGEKLQLCSLCLLTKRAQKDGIVGLKMKMEEVSAGSAL